MTLCVALILYNKIDKITQNIAMWWLFLILLIILAVYYAIFVFSYGIKFSIRIDVNNLSVCTKCFIFDYIEIFSFDFFECQCKFYYKVNKHQIKILQLTKDDTDNDKKTNKKLNLRAYLCNLWNKRPNINVKELNIEYSAYAEDAKNRALLDGCAMILSNAFLATNSKFVVKNFSLKNTNSNFSGAEINAVLGFSLLKIAFFSIYALLIKNKYKKRI